MRYGWLCLVMRAREGYERVVVGVISGDMQRVEALGAWWILIFCCMVCRQIDNGLEMVMAKGTFSW